MNYSSRVHEARALAASGRPEDIGEALLWIMDLRPHGISAADAVHLLALDLNDTRRVSGRLRSLARQGKIRAHYVALTRETYYIKVTNE